MLQIWVAEKLAHDHQQQLMEKADRARQAQDAQQKPPARKHRSMLERLRAEMSNL